MEGRHGKAESERVGRRKGFSHQERELDSPLTIFSRFVLLRLIYLILDILDLLKKPHGGS
jgi:hypothetical protein